MDRPPQIRAISLGASAAHAGDRGFDLDGLYRAHWNELCVFVKRKFGEGPPEPEDVVQAAFIRFATHKDPTSIHNPRAFLYKTASNIVIDHRRAEQVARRNTDDMLARAVGIELEDIGPERVLEIKDRLALVIDVIEALPAKQKAVLIMKRVHGATFKEITARTGWSTGDVHRALQSALSALNETLARADRLDNQRDGKGQGSV